MVEIKHLSDEALCMRENDMAHIRREPGKKYRAIHRQLGNIGTVTAVPIVMFETGTEYLADKVTGSLYDPKTLQCLTGDIQLKAMK